MITTEVVSVIWKLIKPFIKAADFNKIDRRKINDNKNPIDYKLKIR